MATQLIGFPWLFWYMTCGEARAEELCEFVSPQMFAPFQEKTFRNNRYELLRPGE